MDIIIWPTLYEQSTGFGIIVPVYTGAYTVTPDVNHTRYIVKVDWDNDGDFSEASEDITADVKEIKYRRGFDSERNNAMVGQLELRLRNDCGDYTPSLHTETVLPGRLVQVWTETGGSYVLFTGYIDEITPHPELSSQDCFVSAVDGLDYLSRVKLYLPLQDSTISKAWTDMLTGASWPTATRELKWTGAWNYAIYCFAIAGEKARYSLDKLASTVAGRFYIDRRGYAIMEDRTYRDNYKKVSQFTFDNTMTSIQCTTSRKNVFNRFEMDVYAEEEVTPNDLVGTIHPYIAIEASGSETFWVPINGVYAYYQVQAYASSGGTSYSVTATPTYYSNKVKVVVTNGNGVTVTVNTIYVYGHERRPYLLREIAEDETSQTNNQLRESMVDAYYIQPHKAIVNYLIEFYKDARDELYMTVINKTSALLAQILSLDISDRVTIVNDKLGIDGDFFIESVSHDITDGGLRHEVAYRLTSCGLSAPTVETGGSSMGESWDDVTLEGTLISAGGATTTCYFEYGTTISYGSDTSDDSEEVGSGETWDTDILELSAGTYHYRAVAVNSQGTVYGQDNTFTIIEPD